VPQVRTGQDARAQISLERPPCNNATRRSCLSAKSLGGFCTILRCLDQSPDTQHCRQRFGPYHACILIRRNAVTGPRVLILDSNGCFRERSCDPSVGIVLPNRHGARISSVPLRGVLSLNLMATEEELKAEIARFRAENQALQRPARGQMSLKVSEKGALSVYGLGRFPVTLYREQWEKLLGMADEIRAFIQENDGALKKKE